MKRFITITLAMIVASSAPASDAPWVTSRHEYEGFPLYLRHPASLGIKALQPLFPLRIVVTLEFEKTQANGLPEPKYNNTLEDLDLHVVRHLSARDGGRCVLVETFGGKRTFYAYARDAAVANDLKQQLAKAHALHKVTIESEPDPNWSFIRRYDKEYKLFGWPLQ